MKVAAMKPSNSWPGSFNPDYTKNNHFKHLMNKYQLRREIT